MGERKRAIIVFLTILSLFLLGIHIGSIGVIDPIGAKPWYVAQVMNSPAVFFIGHISAGGAYETYGGPYDIGQIYTSIAGLLNLLCIVNAALLAHSGWDTEEDT